MTFQDGGDGGRNGISVQYFNTPTENELLIKYLTFSLDNSKRFTGSDIHHEGDGGKGNNYKEQICSAFFCTCIVKFKIEKRSFGIDFWSFEK